MPFVTPRNTVFHLYLHSGGKAEQERESISSLTSGDSLKTQGGIETGFKCFTLLVNRFYFSVEDQLNRKGR